jgi:hypothetical protein
MRTSTGVLVVAGAAALAVVLLWAGPIGVILIAAPVVAAALFATVLRVPEWYIASPGVLVALALLVSGFFARDYGSGRAHVVAVAAVSGAVVLVAWLGGVRAGRAVRRSARREA